MPKLVVFLVFFCQVLTCMADLRPKSDSLNKVYEESLKVIRNMHADKKQPRVVSSLLEFVRYHAASESVRNLEDAVLMGRFITKVRSVSVSELAQLIGSEAVRMDAGKVPFRRLLYARTACSLGQESKELEEILSSHVGGTSFSILIKKAEHVEQFDPERKSLMNKDFKENCQDFFDDYKFSSFSYSRMNVLTSINYIISVLHQYGIQIEVESEHLSIMKIERAMNGVKYYYGPHPQDTGSREEWGDKSLTQILGYICDDYNLEIEYRDSRVYIVDSNVAINVDMPKNGYWVRNVLADFKEDRESAGSRYGKTRGKFESYIKGVSKTGFGQYYLVLTDNSRVYFEEEQADPVVLKELMLALKDWRKYGIQERRDAKRQKLREESRGLADETTGENEEFHVSFTALCRGLDFDRLKFDKVEDIYLTYEGRSLLK